MKKAIEKLRNQVAEKENLISGIENFLSLNAYEQLKIILKSPLRYDGETPRQWVIDTFKIKPECLSTTEKRIAFYYNGFSIIIESTGDITVRNQNWVERFHNLVQDFRKYHSSLRNSSMLDIERFILNPSFKNFYCVVNLPSIRFNFKESSRRRISKYWFSYFRNKEIPFFQMELSQRVRDVLRNEEWQSEQTKMEELKEVEYPKALKDFKKQIVPVLDKLEKIGFLVSYQNNFTEEENKNL